MGIADERPALLVAREVDGFVLPAGVAADEHRRRVLGVVQVGAVRLSPPIHGVQVEARGPVGGQGVRIVQAVEARHGVECDVVVDELPEVGVARRDVWVVPGRAGRVGHGVAQRSEGGVGRGERGQFAEQTTEAPVEGTGARQVVETARAASTVMVEGGAAG